MINWAALTPSQHEAVFNALVSLSDDIRAVVKERIAAAEQGETLDQGRLIEATFIITAEMRQADDDLARRSRVLELIMKGKNQ